MQIEPNGCGDQVPADGTFGMSITQDIAGEPTVVAAKLGYRSARETFLFTPIEPVATSAWLAISRQDAAAHWPGWRTALYSPRPGSAPSAVLGPR